MLPCLTKVVRWEPLGWLVSRDKQPEGRTCHHGSLNPVREATPANRNQAMIHKGLCAVIWRDVVMCRYLRARPIGKDTAQYPRFDICSEPRDCCAIS